MMGARLWTAIVALVMSACTTVEPAAQFGQQEFSDPSAFSNSQLNAVSCATCHQTTDSPDPTRLDPGYDLRGVVARTGTWGGQVDRLADAVNACLTYFMRQPTSSPFDPTSPEATALYDYLVSITPAGSPTAVQPVTIVANIAPIATGDAGNGAVIYAHACARCHGEAHTGKGSIIRPADVVLPEYTSTCVNGQAGLGAGCYQAIFPGVAPGLVVIEKIRHGRFFDVGGTMPFYSEEVISDAEIGDLLAFLDLPSM
jgi:thiosulfate dehydrogenase